MPNLVVPRGDTRHKNFNESYVSTYLLAMDQDIHLLDDECYSRLVNNSYWYKKHINANLRMDITPQDLLSFDKPELDKTSLLHTTVQRCLPYIELQDAIMNPTSFIDPLRAEKIHLVTIFEQVTVQMPPLVLILAEDFAELRSIREIVLGHVDLYWQPTSQQNLRVLKILNLSQSDSASDSSSEFLNILRVCPMLEELILANIPPIRDDVATCYIPRANLPKLKDIRILGTVTNIRTLLANLKVPSSANVYLMPHVEKNGQENFTDCFDLPATHQFLPLHEVNGVVITSGPQRGGFIVEGFPYPVRSFGIDPSRSYVAHFTIEIQYEGEKIWLGSSMRGSYIVARDIAQVPPIFPKSSHVTLRCDTSTGNITEQDWRKVYSNFSTVFQLSIENIADTRYGKPKHRQPEVWLSSLGVPKSIGNVLCPALNNLFLCGVTVDQALLRQLCKTLGERGLSFKLCMLTIIRRNENEGLCEQDWKWLTGYSGLLGLVDNFEYYRDVGPFMADVWYNEFGGSDFEGF
ncbi:unnamed protein product [Somion occarium]|uniref:Uncharacterized protein n=1 Tax=Somion occarium TaxID=3059160 RepID=A0ABP1D652_9APHY